MILKTIDSEENEETNDAALPQLTLPAQFSHRRDFLRENRRKQFRISTLLNSPGYSAVATKQARMDEMRQSALARPGQAVE